MSRNEKGNSRALVFLRSGPGDALRRLWRRAESQRHAVGLSGFPAGAARPTVFARGAREGVCCRVAFSAKFLIGVNDIRLRDVGDAP